MTIDKIVAKQYRDKVNQSVSQFGNLSILLNHALSKEGLLRTMRTAQAVVWPKGGGKAAFRGC